METNQKTKCVKCGYESESNLEKFRVPVCSVCFRFAPNNEGKFIEYVKEKVDSRALESFRKYSEIGLPQNKGMLENLGIVKGKKSAEGSRGGARGGEGEKSWRDMTDKEFEEETDAEAAKGTRNSSVSPKK